MNEQLGEWEYMMYMLQEDKNRMMQELDEVDVKEKRILGELDNVREVFGMEKRKERKVKEDDEEEEVVDDNDDDVFEVDSGSGIVVIELEKVKVKFREFVFQNDQLKQDLDSVYVSKGDSIVEIQFVKRELVIVICEKEFIEREKELLFVIIKLV